MQCAWQHNILGGCQWAAVPCRVVKAQVPGACKQQQTLAQLKLCLSFCGLWCRDGAANADAAIAVAQLQLMLGQASLTASSSDADTALASLRTAANTVSQYGEAMLHRTPAVSPEPPGIAHF